MIGTRFFESVKDKLVVQIVSYKNKKRFSIIKIIFLKISCKSRKITYRS
jgi:hypothetical protein